MNIVLFAEVFDDGLWSMGCDEHAATASCLFDIVLQSTAYILVLVVVHSAIYTVHDCMWHMRCR